MITILNLKASKPYQFLYWTQHSIEIHKLEFVKSLSLRYRQCHFIHKSHGEPILCSIIWDLGWFWAVGSFFSLQPWLLKTAQNFIFIYKFFNPTISCRISDSNSDAISCWLGLNLIIISKGKNQSSCKYFKLNLTLPPTSPG